MIYAVITLAIILTMYAAGNYLLYTLPVVEAGPISGVRHTGLQRTHQRLNSSYRVMKNGTLYNYRRFIVQGDCMSCQGIMPQDIIAVRIFDNDNDKSTLKQNDFVLIFLNDKKFRGYKIRRIKDLTKDMANTFYYTSSGAEQPSSESHALKNIIGIVDLKESGISA